MPASFLHGVETIEIEKGARTIKTVKTAVVGLVGTAPIQNVDEEYRNKGVARILLEKTSELAKTAVGFDELYLFTKHIGLYEKFGWEYISEIDTYIENPRFQRLYKLNFKKPS